MDQDRRQFIKRSVYSVLALLGLGFLVPGLKVCSPLSSERSLVFFPLMAEDEIPHLGVKKAELVYTSAGKERKTRVFIVVSAEGPRVLSATCSHLGCLVNYSKEKREFVCPCHGGRYDLTGKNIAGPPPSPLSRLPIRIQDNTLMVGVKV